MSMFVVRGRLDRQLAPGSAPIPLDFDQMMLDGSARDPSGTGGAMIEAMDFNQMSVQSLMNGMEENVNAKRGSRV